MGWPTAAVFCSALLCGFASGAQPDSVLSASGNEAVTAEPPLQEIVVVGERAGPRLWKVTKGDHVLWVFGTLNHLPRRMSWRSSEVEAALAHCQELLTSGPSVSASIGPIAAIKLYFQWRRTQKDPNRSTLRDWLPPPVYARFEALKARYDARDAGIEQLRPTFAALRLYQHAVDAAGLTQRDEIEQAVVSLAKRRNIPVHRAQLKIEDPAGALTEVGELSPAVEVECLSVTLTRLETDLPSMQQRAQAWAIGDVQRLRSLPYPNQREVCMNALANAPRIKALVERAQQGWSLEAEAALNRNAVSFAIRPVYDLLAADGPLARFRAEGYGVEGP